MAGKANDFWDFPPLSAAAPPDLRFPAIEARSHLASEVAQQDADPKDFVPDRVGITTSLCRIGLASPPVCAERHLPQLRFLPRSTSPNYVFCREVAPSKHKTVLGFPSSLCA